MRKEYTDIFKIYLENILNKVKKKHIFVFIKENWKIF